MGNELSDEAVDTRLRELSFSGEPAYVRVAELTVDQRYQRSLNMRRVRRMSNEFDPLVVGMIVVSHRKDGTKVVLDGQHRRAMFVQMGWEDQLIPAFVYRNLTLVDEARIFRMMNENRARPTSIDLFRSKVVEGDPVAVDIRTILLSAGLRVSSDGEPTAFRAIASAMRVYVDSGRENFRTVVQVLKSAWSTSNQAQAWHGDMLLGVAILLAEYGKQINLERLIRQMQGDTPVAVLGRARSARAVLGGETSGLVAGQLVNLYNKNLRTNRLEDYTKRPWRRNPLRVDGNGEETS